MVHFLVFMLPKQNAIHCGLNNGSFFLTLLEAGKSDQATSRSGSGEGSFWLVVSYLLPVT